jgi:hypothetical protein
MYSFVIKYEYCDGLECSTLTRDEVGVPEGKSSLGNLDKRGVDGNILLKCIIKE